MENLVLKDYIFFGFSLLFILYWAMSRDRMQTAAVAYVITLPTVDLPGTYLSTNHNYCLLSLTLLFFSFSVLYQYRFTWEALKRIKFFFLLLFLFLLSLVASFQYTAFPQTGPQTLIRLAGLIWTCCLLAFLVNRKALTKLLVKTFVLTMIVLSSLSPLQFFWKRFIFNIGRTKEFDYDYFIEVAGGLVRAPAAFTDPNNMGIFSALALILVLAFSIDRYQYERKLDKPAFLAGLLLSAALFFSLTRTALFAFFFGALLLSAKKRLKVILTILLILTLAAAFVMRAPEKGIKHIYQPHILGERPVYWQACLKMAKETPFLGVGPGNFHQALIKSDTKLSLKSQPLSHRPHNLFLGLLAETGIIGLTLFSSLLLSLFWLLIKKRSQLPVRLCLISLSMVLIHASLHNLLMQDLLWVLLGLGINIGCRTENGC